MVLGILSSSVLFEFCFNDLGENNCLETFENTAAFSRDFQGAQDCMCDTEHMMDCSSNGENIEDGGLSSHITNSDFDQIVEHLQVIK